jgi:hypothetical protein
MAGKPWDRQKIGPRPPLTAPEGPANPVNGCFNGCGEVDPRQLRWYGLTLDGRPTRYVWLLCFACLDWGCPLDPREADPLTVVGAA